MSRERRRGLWLPQTARDLLGVYPQGTPMATFPNLPRISVGPPPRPSGVAQQFPTLGQDGYELSDEQVAALQQVIDKTQSSDQIEANNAYNAWNSAIAKHWPQVGPLGLAGAAGANLGSSIIYNILGTGIEQQFTDIGLEDAGLWHVTTNCYHIALTSAKWSAEYTVGNKTRRDFTITGVSAYRGKSTNPITGLTQCVSCNWIPNPGSGEPRTQVTAGGDGIRTSIGLNPNFQIVDDGGIGGHTNWGMQQDFPGDISDNETNCPDPRTLSYDQELADKIGYAGLQGYAMRGFRAEFNPPGTVVCVKVSHGQAGAEDREINVCSNQTLPTMDPLDGLGDLEPLGDLGDMVPDFTPTPEELADFADCLMDPECSGDWGFDPDDLPPDVEVPPPSGGFDPFDPGFPCSGNPGGPVLPPPTLPPGTGGLPTPGTPLDNMDMDLDQGLPPAGSFEPPGDLPYEDGFPTEGMNPGDPGQIEIPDGPGFCGNIGEVGKDFKFDGAPWVDSRFTKKTCYQNEDIVSIAKKIGKDLGINTEIWVDKDCKEKWTGCFKKGVNKFDALKFLADKCGYDIFPEPCPPGSTDPLCIDLGHVEPLDIWHGPYHELVNLYVFDPVYDALDVVSYVQITRPDYPGLPGFEIVKKVPSVYKLPQDKWLTYIVGSETTFAQAETMANKLVTERAGEQAKIEVAVPYNPKIYPRHQFWVLRPTLNFMQKYMVVGITHECSKEEGYITKISGRIYFSPDPDEENPPEEEPPIPEPEVPQPPKDPTDPGTGGGACNPSAMDSANSQKPNTKDQFQAQYPPVDQ